jgi:hypothetical protein
MAHLLAHGGRRCVPEALASQVRGVHGRWGLLIGDGNDFPLPLWAWFCTQALEERAPVSPDVPSRIAAEDALRLLALCEEMVVTVTLPGHAPEHHPACCRVWCP